MTILLSLGHRFQPTQFRSTTLNRSIRRIQTSIVRRTLVVHSSRRHTLKQARHIRTIHRRPRNIRIRAQINLIRSTRHQLRRNRLRSLITLLLTTQGTRISQPLRRLNISVRHLYLFTRRLRRLTHKRLNLTTHLTLHIRHNPRRNRISSTQGLSQMLRHRRRTNNNTNLKFRHRRILAIRHNHPLNRSVTITPHRGVQNHKLPQPIQSRSHVGLTHQSPRNSTLRSLLILIFRLSVRIISFRRRHSFFIDTNPQQSNLIENTNAKHNDVKIQPNPTKSR